VPLASAADMQAFYSQLAQVLEEIDFRDRTGSGHLMNRLQRLFQRAVLDQNEINILRGILTAVQGRRRRAGDPHPRRPEPTP
jgi:tRNA C32,U32 (ribose-2'-O)-methylase TrmJ